MNRAQKEAFVNELGEGVAKAQAFALLSFAKLSVEQMTTFRLSLSKQNVKVKVVKNTLARRVLGATEYKDAVVHLEGPTLLAYSEGDPISTAKAICEWAGKEGLDIKLKGGAALGKVVSSDQMKALSKLPGRNEMFVSFLWALKSHPTKFLYGLQDKQKKLLYAVSALKDKKEKEGA